MPQTDPEDFPTAPTWLAWPVVWFGNLKPVAWLVSKLQRNGRG